MEQPATSQYIAYICLYIVVIQPVKSPIVQNGKIQTIWHVPSVSSHVSVLQASQEPLISLPTPIFRNGSPIPGIAVHLGPSFPGLSYPDLAQNLLGSICHALCVNHESEFVKMCANSNLSLQLWPLRNINGNITVLYIIVNQIIAVKGHNCVNVYIKMNARSDCKRLYKQYYGPGGLCIFVFLFHFLQNIHVYVLFQPVHASFYQQTGTIVSRVRRHTHTHHCGLRGNYLDVCSRRVSIHGGDPQELVGL